MTYTVVWQPRAVIDLAELWVEALDQAEMTRACRRIDSALESNPFDVGESREPPYRLLFEPPLAVVYEVDVPTANDYVLRVGPAGQPV